MDLGRYASTPFGEARRAGGRHGYVAYFPGSIPRTIDLPARTVRLLGDAESSLGRLDGVGRLLPDPDLLIRPYLIREAISSTRIEGTRASIAEVYDAALVTPPSVDGLEVCRVEIARSSVPSRRE